jgi:hypothetical protein
MSLAPLPLYLDSTMLSAFRSCPQKFYLEFVRGLRGEGTSIDLHCGSCVAHCFETVYNAIHIDGLSAEKAMQLGMVQFDLDWGDVEPRTVRIKKDGTPQFASPKTKERTWEVIEAYFAQWPPLFDHIQPLFIAGTPTVEFTFAIPLTKETLGYEVPLHPSGDPFLYSGRIDFLGRWGKTILPLDHKTGSRMDPSWTEKWDLRSQFLGYVWACEQLGIPCQRHFAVRGIIIQTTEFHLPEAIKTYPLALLDRWKGQVARDVHRLVDCHNSGYFDYNFGETCTSYGLCQFFHACRSDDPELWLKDFKPRFWNPLAKDPTAKPPPEEYTPILPHFEVTI